MRLNYLTEEEAKMKVMVMDVSNSGFVPMRLEEERAGDKRKIFTVSCNEREQELLKRIQIALDIKSEGQALKESALIGLNVIHKTFGEKFLRYLFKKNRSRLSDFENI